MSATSIHDEGYTSPDFLEKLFKTSSTIESENTVKSITGLSSMEPSYYFSHSCRGGDLRGSPSRLNRSICFHEEERISTKKFKIFYGAVLEGLRTPSEIEEIWGRFERSLTNPFDYDRFIESLRDVKLQGKNDPATPDKAADYRIQITAPVRKSKSTTKVSSMAQQRVKSESKITRVQSEERAKMKSSISYVRKVMNHGYNYIKK